MVAKKKVKSKKSKSIDSVKKLMNEDLKMVKKAMKKDADTVKKISKKKLKMNSEKKFTCYNCGNEVDELVKQVSLATSDKGKIVEEIIFHFECWVEYISKQINKKAKEGIATVQKKVMGLMDNPLLKSVLSNVKGIDSIFAMVNTPLSEEGSKEIIDKIREKMEDDRKKREEA